MNFYKDAAKVLDDLSSKKHGSLKSLVFDSKTKGNATEQKRLYALLSETLKKKDVLESVIESSQLLKIERKAVLPWRCLANSKAKISRALALVLVHDLLCSKGGIGAGSGPIKDAILRHKTRLKADFVKAELRKNKVSTSDKAFVPRWIRVNQLKTTMDDFISILDLFDFKPVSQLNDLDSIKMGYFIDPNIPDLFAFSPHHPIQSTFEKEYTSGGIILQDKASCIPVVLLDPPRGARVLDACAAPGNKTTQLAAAVGSRGQVVAVERDQKRVETLKFMVEKAGATKFSEIINGDFTKVDPALFDQVTHILLDPSCSGSGLDRPDFTIATDSDLLSRLRRLATFQTTLLKHAMSFANVEKVVYSTCSIHTEENEQVASAVLQEMQGWRVVTRDEQVDCLRKWHRRGLVEECPSKEVAEACIRCETGTDGTIGFFAVAFTRVHEENGFDKEEEEEEWQGIP